LTAPSSPEVPEKPKPRSDRLYLTISVAGILVVVLLAIVALSWRQLLIRYDVYELKKLRAQHGSAWELAEGTDECVWAILVNGGVKKGMRFEQVVALLGEPQRDFPATGISARRCEWLTTDMGLGHEQYVVTFDSNGKADFVPWISKRERMPTGTVVAHMIRTPEEAAAIGE
jgi:hypothetical protein